MPSIIPGYVYSLFAALLVGIIVVCACNAAAVSIRSDADRQQLRNMADYVAAQSLTLLSHGGNCENVTQTLDLPSTVGNQRFWIRLQTESGNTWVEAGFGPEPLEGLLRVDVPALVSAQGTYVSGAGHPVLVCIFENETSSLTLTME